MNGSTESGPAEFWTRLRRRKVVQWGLVYAAAAWGFLQGLEYVSEAFHWPDQLRQIALLALLIGLPIVLVLAWYHGDRGQQRISTSEFGILTLLLLLGGGAFWYYEHASNARSEDHASTAGSSQSSSSSVNFDARPSIAVLPFENRSRDADDVFFVDGVHDDILTQLSKVSALRVISRTSVEQFRGTKLPMKAIADQLGVTKILEGGVQRGGDRVRINVQLIDAATDTHLWAENYDRELDAANIFAIQSELAFAIAGALRTALTPTEQTRAQATPTENLDAWENYQLGKRRMTNRSTAALREAEHFFRKATDLDPRFALAWVGLADAISMQVYYGSRPRDAGLTDAESAVVRALEMDPNLAEAWATAGAIAESRVELGKSEEKLRKAIELNPNYAPAYHWLSMTVTDLGRRDDALETIERGVALDPLSAIIQNWLGVALGNVGRFHDAASAFRRAIEIEPTMAVAYSNLAAVLGFGLGRVGEAVPWLERSVQLDPGNPDNSAALAETYWELGDDANARRWLERALSTGEPTAYTHFVAAVLYLDWRDETSAQRHARTAANLDTYYLFPLRDFELRHGAYASARALYAKAYPELFGVGTTRLSDREAVAALEVVPVLQHLGESDLAKKLLDRSEAYVRTIPRTGLSGFWFSDVVIDALRGDRSAALTKLRKAEQEGCRTLWRYSRDFAPGLASIRNESEFKAVFVDIERDMAQQRARLAARPKGAPLELTEAPR